MLSRSKKLLGSNTTFAKGSNFLKKKVTANLPKQTLPNKKEEKKEKKKKERKTGA